jgi:hypothetical protein
MDFAGSVTFLPGHQDGLLERRRKGIENLFMDFVVPLNRVWALFPIEIPPPPPILVSHYGVWTR